MLIAACHLWHREDASGPKKSFDMKQSYSVTHLYLELLDQMIQNAAKKQNKQRSLIQNPLTSLQNVLSDEITVPSSQPNLPDILKTFQYVCFCIDMLLPFCKLAHSDLMSAETKLVFHIGQLERQIGKSQVDLAHKLGLISQAKLRGKYPQPNVSVSFYHKSVQELLAAVYITCGNRDAVTSFCDYCSTYEKVMETANITKFVIGLHPVLGSRLCEHIANMVNSDPAITEYRQTFNILGTGGDRVRQLYRTQCEWYRELTHSRTVTGDTSPPPSLHVTDIYLDSDKDSDTVRLTGELMSANRDTIVSVYLWGVDDPLHRVAQYLPQCRHLSTLYITNMYNTETRAQIVAVISRLTQLDTIRYHGRLGAVEDHVASVAAVLRLTQLRCIRLYSVRLGYDDDDDDHDDDDDVLVLTADWTRLQTVVLRYVDMSAVSWGRFVSSLLTVPHPVHVTLRETDIDADTRRRIQTSPHFTGAGDYNRRTDFTFTTVPHSDTVWWGEGGQCTTLATNTEIKIEYTWSRGRPPILNDGYFMLKDE